MAMRSFLGLLILSLMWASSSLAQVPSPVQATIVQPMPAYYAQIPISATAAINTQTTLTIPAPAPNLYNYICFLGFNASQNGTSTAISNAVTTSTNFQSFALKFSLAATANLNYDWTQRWGAPSVGCVKSTAPGTATTFVSPAAVAQAAFTWYGTYYQAP
jgi:hypothetical protein